MQGCDTAGMSWLTHTAASTQAPCECLTGTILSGVYVCWILDLVVDYSPPRRLRVFLLGPSHHFYTKRCLLSTATSFDTPLGE